MTAGDSLPIQIRSLADCTFNQAVELWNLGFSGYYSDMSMTLESFIPRLGRESIRPELSVAAFVDGEPAGFVLVAMKKVDGVPIAWNGGTGVNPKFRGKGLAKRLMLEAVEAMKRGGAVSCVLEVVQKNAGAIAAYESSGFQIRDGLIGARRTGPLPDEIREAAQKLREYPIGQAKPHQLAKLPFFRHETAWSAAWFNHPEAEGILVFDKDGAVGAYALVVRRYDDEGKLASVTLLQCAADPSRAERKQLLHAALAAAFGPLEEDCRRATDNLSTSDPELAQWLTSAGFETVYTQYLMIAELREGQG
ncbi:GNAT family N-acetyltransferase [Paenibacillus ginsengarvi]|uniref:GNAT family N-acetyltransferase n=1 Tax=Paenibacillus ginsengarvi TaxID=400777 RepID=A0A3B0CLT6_9BACL|nr:GNAT family N-acetyltransferase [Paenibacillus ginsengarvi]RKN86635.1 GNAT family N-acetyltransferase [Paenibacillus ginsengarvi]